jgi:hypothetical protein
VPAVVRTVPIIVIPSPPIIPGISEVIAEGTGPTVVRPIGIIPGTVPAVITIIWRIPGVDTRAVIIGPVPWVAIPVVKIVIPIVQLVAVVLIVVDKIILFASLSRLGVLAGSVFRIDVSC